MTIRSKSVPRNSFTVLKLTQHLPILSHATSKQPARKRFVPLANNIASSGDKLLCELHRKVHKSLRSVILLDKVASSPTTIRGNEPLTDEEDDDEVDATAASKKHQAFALAGENSRHS